MPLIPSAALAAGCTSKIKNMTLWHDGIAIAIRVDHCTRLCVILQSREFGFAYNQLAATTVVASSGNEDVVVVGMTAEESTWSCWCFSWRPELPTIKLYFKGKGKLLEEEGGGVFK
jgi:hypothetical protein